MTAPACGTCGMLAELVFGRTVWPGRPDLADKPVWRCTFCPDARVGCHPGTIEPLGTPASAELRRARSILHEKLIDPLWLFAPQSGGYGPRDDEGKRAIRRAARVRVYAFLASRLRIDPDVCHVGMFDLDRCRAAYRALKGVGYAEIRDWAKAREAPPSPKVLKRRRKRFRQREKRRAEAAAFTQGRPA